MKRSLIIAAVLGALVLSVFGLGRLWVQASLPPPSDRGAVAGLDSGVTILLDSLGVPHVIAHSELDAYAALGWLHARDRAFQMELLRHAAMGRLSELFGARTIGADRDLRALEIGRIARARIGRMSDASRRAAEAYARGVDAWLASGPRALELRILGHEAEPWEPEHSLAIGVLQSLDLRFDGHELDLAEVAARLGRAKAEELIQPALDPEPTIVTGSAQSDRMSFPLSTYVERGTGGEDDGPRASNAWVVSGSRTASGKPVLANDPHLTLRAPSLWYLAALHAPGLDVVGTTIPGVPAVVLGHTPRVAWGFTNAMVDDADYVLEELSPDSSQVRTAAGWAPVEVVAETIRVKDNGPVIYARRRTAHGPLVDVVPAPDPPHALALRWVAQDGGADELAALHAFARAAGLADFTAAVALFRSPEQNIVYADSAGNIAYFLGGAVPVRRQGTGNFPVAGAGGPVWTRYLTAAELPRILDPPSGRIVTANNRVVDASYPFFISNHYDEGYRAARIAQLLAADSPVTADAMRAAQLDRVDLFARDARRHAARAAIDARRADIGDRLHAWDGTVTADAVEPTLFWTWYRWLRRLTYADESPDYRPNAPLHRWLSAGESAWFDDTRTPGVETLADIARQAMESTLAARSVVPWGEVHQTVMEHPLGAVPVLGKLLGFTIGPFPNGGDEHTVNVAIPTRAPFTSGYGPSMRHVVDLAHPDSGGGFIIPTGQSGHPLSRHYRDQLTWWREGKLWVVPVDVRRVRARDTLWLVAAPRPDERE